MWGEDISEDKSEGICEKINRRIAAHALKIHLLKFKYFWTRPERAPMTSESEQRMRAKTQKGY